MRSPTASLVVAGLLALAGCASVYIFQRPANSPLEVEAARGRLQALLEAEGLQAVGASDEMTGDIGCGQNAPDRVAFAKHWRAWWEYHRILVHEFSCDGNWYVVILSSTHATTEQSDLRDAIAKEFAAEIASGALQLHSTYRLALE